MELVPCRRTADPDDLHPEPPDLETLHRIQRGAEKHLKTRLAAVHDQRIGVDCSSPHCACRPITPSKPGPTKKRPNVAVVSSNGMEVDLHLGQAYQVLIYGPREDGLACLLETRPAPEPGSSDRWEELAERLPDCFAILAASAGERPRNILGDHGITILITDGEIESTVDMLYGGGKK
jgi:nitrogen fixation protein NifB